MGPICIGLTLNALLAEHILSLGCTEKIGCKFCAAHMIKYILRLFQAFPFMYVFSIKTSIKSFVSFILKYRIVKRSFYTRIVGSPGKLCIMLPHLITQ